MTTQAGYSVQPQMPGMPHTAAATRRYKLSWVERVIILQYSLGPFLYFIRATPFEDTLAGIVLLRTIEPLILVVTGLAVITLKRIRFDIPITLLCGIAVYGSVAGFAQGNEIANVIAGLTHFSLGILLYLYFRNAGFDRERFEYFLRILLWWATPALIISISVLFVLKAVVGLGVYLGIGSQIGIFLFFYALYRRQSLLALATLALILASGKRGVLVALLLGLFSYSGLWVVNVRFSQSLKLLIAMIFTVFVIAVSAPHILEPIIEKVLPEEEVSLNQYSSGRLNELLSAIGFYTETPERIILGAGFGFTYTYLQESLFLGDVEEYKNVHFSYVNPVISFGAILSVIYYMALAAIVVGGTFPLARNFEWVLQCGCVALLFYYIFVFGLFNEAIFWASLGYLNRVKQSDTNVQINPS